MTINKYNLILNRNNLVILFFYVIIDTCFLTIVFFLEKMVTFLELAGKL